MTGQFPSSVRVLGAVWVFLGGGGGTRVILLLLADFFVTLQGPPIPAWTASTLRLCDIDIEYCEIFKYFL